MTPSQGGSAAGFRLLGFGEWGLPAMTAESTDACLGVDDAHTFRALLSSPELGWDVVADHEEQANSSDPRSQDLEVLNSFLEFTGDNGLDERDHQEAPRDRVHRKQSPASIAFKRPAAGPDELPKGRQDYEPSTDQCKGSEEIVQGSCDDEGNDRQAEPDYRRSLPNVVVIHGSDLSSQAVDGLLKR